ncbi:N-methyl-L-tryptophan oxidase [Floricoccus penangensis]|uniref:N-methyl-L-tryptophan oxidase n=1 Tax=Floricoccus penangensis TaxID=1859475 RepID=UPI00203C7CB3|nr:N-methyl-L-tryptophan oxidase [Floricoccus penangensis]URZ87591.1 N-methyl-L-tryptophan oxidase [Floricoccus penangensis]
MAQNEDKIYDLVVIGCGSVGSAVGYYASREGASVLEIDSYQPPHDFGTHHGQTRIIRHAYGEGDKYVPLLLEAQSLWEELQDQTEEKFLHQVGIVNIAPQESDFYKNVLSSAEKYSLPVDILTAEELNERFPTWNFDDDYKAIYEKNAGYLRTDIIIKEYLEKAKECGATQVFNQQVFQIINEPDYIRIITDNAEYKARKLVVSAGSWVKSLYPDLPIQPVRKTFHWFEVEDESLLEKKGFPCFTVNLKSNETYYGFPGSDNLIKIGRHDGGQDISNYQEQYEYDDNKDAKEVENLLGTYLIGTGKLDFGKTCSYDISPDEDFIIDWLDDRTQIVTGLSGHGFKFVSVLGHILANRALGKEETNLDLSPFALDRFTKITEKVKD